MPTLPMLGGSQLMECSVQASVRGTMSSSPERVPRSAMLWYIVRESDSLGFQGRKGIQAVKRQMFVGKKSRHSLVKVFIQSKRFGKQLSGLNDVGLCCAVVIANRGWVA
ncbi:hypothetical protein V6N12_068390 [Hibiscus sabdariffa]|uniref:Uncharacterized protein n=1 Tax=Hibiscus sabdariffa TaxID=183260 RepID=A0ABR2FPV5_9ROSI